MPPQEGLTSQLGREAAHSEARAAVEQGSRFPSTRVRTSRWRGGLARDGTADAGRPCKHTHRAIE